MPEVINVRFRGKGKAYYFDPAGTDPHAGEDVIVETAKGPELGQCVRAAHTVEDSLIVPPLRPVIRIATEIDQKIVRENSEKEKTAFDYCQKRIEERKLDMKLVDVEYSFDGSKILFFFTSDGRVDFRELVKDLAGVFRTRIELRQIGVRDSAKLVGGLGICGRPFCCSSFLDNFQPVSIKMAKTQSLSLNPSKISGTCGRLMCCLKYEQEAYEHLLKTTPKVDTPVDTPDGKGSITEVNLLRRKVKVKLADQNVNDVRQYPLRDLGYTIGGEYKAPEPPEEKPGEHEEELFSFPAFQSGGSVSVSPGLAEQAPGEESHGEEKGEHSRNHRRNRRHRGKGSQHGAEQPAQAEPAKSGKQEKPKQSKQNQAQGAEKPKAQDKPRQEQRHKSSQSHDKQQPKEKQAQAPVPKAEAGAEPKREGKSSRSNRRRRDNRPKGEGTPAPKPVDEKAKARADAVAEAVAAAGGGQSRSRRPGRRRPRRNDGDGSASKQES